MPVCKIEALAIKVSHYCYLEGSSKLTRPYKPSLAGPICIFFEQRGSEVGSFHNVKHRFKNQFLLLTYSAYSADLCALYVKICSFLIPQDRARLLCPAHFEIDIRGVKKMRGGLHRAITNLLHLIANYGGAIVHRSNHHHLRRLILLQFDAQ